MQMSVRKAAGACSVFQLYFLPAPDVNDVWKAQVGFAAALQQEGPQKKGGERKKIPGCCRDCGPAAGAVTC